MHAVDAKRPRMMSDHLAPDMQTVSGAHQAPLRSLATRLFPARHGNSVRKVLLDHRGPVAKDRTRLQRKLSEENPQHRASGRCVEILALQKTYDTKLVRVTSDVLRQHAVPAVVARSRNLHAGNGRPVQIDDRKMNARIRIAAHLREDRVQAIIDQLVVSSIKVNQSAPSMRMRSRPTFRAFIFPLFSSRRT